MTQVFIVIAQNLASLACIVGAILLARDQTDQWGWFLLCGLLLKACPPTAKWWTTDHQAEVNTAVP